MEMEPHPRVAALIAALGLRPHVEGGFYRETFRSTSIVRRATDGAPRAALTSIDFLLPAGTVSRWHLVTSDEAWHLHEGEGLDLFLAPPDIDTLTHVRLGAAIDTDGPAFVVTAGWWQAARPVGAYALTGCTVGPGFEFADFRMMRDDPAATARMRSLGADASSLL